MARTKKTVEPKIKIMDALAINTELEQYQMPKTTGLSYRTVLRTLKHLEKQNLAMVVRTEPSTKGGKEKKIYVLTFKGFLIVLLNHIGEPELIAVIMKKHPEMSLTSKKWDLFENIGVTKHILDILSPFSFSIMLLATGQTRDGIDKAILFPLLTQGIIILPPDVYMALLRLCKDDAELNSFVSKMINIEIKQYDVLVKLRDSWIKT